MSRPRPFLKHMKLQAKTKVKQEQWEILRWMVRATPCKLCISRWNGLVSNYNPFLKRCNVFPLKDIEPLLWMQLGCPWPVPSFGQSVCLGVGSGTKYPELWNMAVSRFQPCIGVLSSKCVFSHMWSLEFWRESWKEIVWVLLWFLFTNQCMVLSVHCIVNMMFFMPTGPTQTIGLGPLTEVCLKMVYP